MRMLYYAMLSDHRFACHALVRWYLQTLMLMLMLMLCYAMLRRPGEWRAGAGWPKGGVLGMFAGIHRLSRAGCSSNIFVFGRSELRCTQGGPRLAGGLHSRCTGKLFLEGHAGVGAGPRPVMLMLMLCYAMLCYASAALGTLHWCRGWEMGCFGCVLGCLGWGQMRRR